MNPIEIVKNTDKSLNITMRDENGDPIDLSSASDITACFKGTSGNDPVVLGIARNEVQSISFSATPDAGNFRLTHEGNETVDIPFGASNTDVETALNNLSSLSAVTVTGSFGSGFIVTFAGADGSKDQPELTATTNTLTSGGNAVTVTVATTTEGRRPGIVGTNLTAGKFRIDMIKSESSLLETGNGKDLEIQWVVSSKCNAKQIKGIFKVLDSLCA